MHSRLTRVAITFIVLFGALSLTPAQATAQVVRPRLIIGISVDQMRYDYLERFANYETGGLHYFFSRGANFANANYHHLPTETGPGHSIMLSGRNPARTGIVSNTWYDRAHRQSMYCVEDAQSKVVGGTAKSASARNFVGEGFGDALQGAFPGARVFSASLKDRAAVLMAGKHPQQVYWYSTEAGTFVSSDYYVKALPDWVSAFNGSHPADGYAGKVWAPLLQPNSPAYANGHSSLPRTLPSAPGPALYGAVFDSPFGDELLERFAEAMITANHLGSGNAPDLLTLSFSSNDSVGHGFGPDSPEIADEQIRLDRTLGRLMNFVRDRLASQPVLWLLTADHGSEPTPEAERALRHNLRGRRIAMKSVVASVEAQLDRIFHQPKGFHWFDAVTEPMFYFDTKNLARHHIAPAAARRALTTRVHVRGMAGFYDAAHPDQIRGWIGSFIRNSRFAGRSGDVYFLADRWTLIADKPTGTNHANPYPYDTHVPFVLAGAGITAAKIDAPVHIADIAPTIAALLGMPWKTDEPESQSRASLIRVGTAAAGAGAL